MKDCESENSNNNDDNNNTCKVITTYTPEWLRFVF